MSGFAAVIDTCVLYSTLSRGLLLELAEQDMFRPIWSDTILLELERSLQSRAGVTATQTQHLTTEIRKAFPEALVSLDPGLVEQVQQNLPDKDDAHVIAAAISGKADAIVTFNLKDFPARTLERFQLEAIHPDDFLLNQWDLDSVSTSRAVRQCYQSLRKNRPGWQEWLGRLERVNLTKFASLLSAVNLDF